MADIQPWDRDEQRRQDSNRHKKDRQKWPPGLPHQHRIFQNRRIIVAWHDPRILPRRCIAIIPCGNAIRRPMASF
jgi:hypothetical protein